MRNRFVPAIVAAFVLTVLTSAPASAQSFQTFVSRNGDNANNCLRTTPCATFSAALGKTYPGGEITCIDIGTFGTLTIDKAITISCQEGTATSVSNVSGILINAGTSDAVYLKGLALSGLGGYGNSSNGTSPAPYAVKLVTGKSLTLENCHIDGNVLGVSFTPSGASFLTIINSTISNNGLPNIGGGIQIAPGASGYASVYLHNVRVVGNYIGIGGSTSGNAIIEIFNSAIANNTGPGISVSGNVSVDLTNSAITGNGGAATSGNVFSAGNNLIRRNSPDTTPTPIALR